jgi:hypothetical protein
MKTMLAVAAVLAAALAFPQAAAGTSVTAQVTPTAQLSYLRTDGGSALLTEVGRELAEAKVTRYQHDTQVDRANGRFFYDCSGFVDYALGVTRPAALRELPSTASAGRPLAQDYVRHLRQPGRAWQTVPSVPELRPGDVIAWLKTEDSASRDTGHVMVVLERPVPAPGRPGGWLIRVADSTRDPHASDSRRGGDGLGTGTIGLDTDGRGRPTAYRWRAALSPHQVATEITLGRAR